MSPRIAVLAGGVGAARFLDGLVRVVPPQDVTAIVNVGDDMEWAGLHIAPDLDTVMYTLAGMMNPETGWGLGRRRSPRAQASRVARRPRLVLDRRRRPRHAPLSHPPPPRGRAALHRHRGALRGCRA